MGGGRGLWCILALHLLHCKNEKDVLVLSHKLTNQFKRWTYKRGISPFFLFFLFHSRFFLLDILAPMNTLTLSCLTSRRAVFHRGCMKRKRNVKGRYPLIWAWIDPPQKEEKESRSYSRKIMQLPQSPHLRGACSLSVLYWSRSWAGVSYCDPSFFFFPPKGSVLIPLDA